MMKGRKERTDIIEDREGTKDGRKRGKEEGRQEK